MKILLTETNFDPETPIKLTQAGFEVFIPKQEIPNVHEFDRSALIQTIKNIQPDILVTGFKFQIDQEILDLAPIKVVFTRTTATDHITGKVEVIKLNGEELTDVVAVPELCLWAMLELVRRRGGQELDGKTLGLIGYGRISKILERYALALGMKVLKYDTNFVETENQSHAGLLEVVLKNSDIVSLHISSTEENRNFMDGDKFMLMKNGSYFLNSSRGWLVKNISLEWAFKKGKLAGAWTDFPVGFTAENLIQTPHIAGKTLESSIKTEKIICEKLIKWLPR